MRNNALLWGTFIQINVHNPLNNVYNIYCAPFLVLHICLKFVRECASMEKRSQRNCLLTISGNVGTLLRFVLHHWIMLHLNHHNSKLKLVETLFINRYNVGMLILIDFYVRSRFKLVLRYAACHRWSAVSKLLVKFMIR